MNARRRSCFGGGEDACQTPSSAYSVLHVQRAEGRIVGLGVCHLGIVSNKGNTARLPDASARLSSFGLTVSNVAIP